MHLSAALLLMVSAAALPEGVTAKAVLEPAVIPFHVPARYTVTVEVPVETRVQMPSMMKRFDGLAAVPEAEHEQILEEGRVRISQTYTVEAVFPGRYAIEPAVVTIDGVDYAIPSPTLTVRELTEAEIEAAERFDAALPELDPAVVAPVWRRGWFWATLAGAVLLGGLIGFTLRRRAVLGLEPEKTPWEIALARLQALRERGLAERREYGRFYVDLSAILRYYIEARFNLHAAERTTPEFLREVAESGVFDARQQDFLAAFLKQCDYVKFARLESSTEEMIDWFKQVTQFVNETKPAEPSEPAEAA